MTVKTFLTKSAGNQSAAIDIIESMTLAEFSSFTAELKRSFCPERIEYPIMEEAERITHTHEEVIIHGRPAWQGMFGSNK